MQKKTRKRKKNIAGKVLKTQRNFVIIKKLNNKQFIHTNLATGGGGVDEGMKAMLQYTQANTVKKMVPQSEKKKISGKK